MYCRSLSLSISKELCRDSQTVEGYAHIFREYAVGHSSTRSTLTWEWVVGGTQNVNVLKGYLKKDKRV